MLRTIFANGMLARRSMFYLGLIYTVAIEIRIALAAKQNSIQNLCNLLSRIGHNNDGDSILGQSLLYFFITVRKEKKKSDM